ncbi:hypothetical protein [Rosistilla oblonga]|uniref:hypothetical protein n=1 Tax=Rosistilla oblonga TaxID=2527990 RepID=UPI003A986437
MMLEELEKKYGFAKQLAQPNDIELVDRSKQRDRQSWLGECLVILPELPETRIATTRL